MSKSWANSYKIKYILNCTLSLTILFNSFFKFFRCSNSPKSWRNKFKLSITCFIRRWNFSTRTNRQLCIEFAPNWQRCAEMWQKSSLLYFAKFGEIEKYYHHLCVGKSRCGLHAGNVWYCGTLISCFQWWSFNTSLFFIPHGKNVMVNQLQRGQK